MSVLVKGMKMPKNCRECLMQVYYSSGKTWCKPVDRLLADDYKPIIYDDRPDWCPLVELPEKHGRLVEFVDVETETDEDTGLEEINVGEMLSAYLRMRGAKPIIDAEGNE